MWLRQQLLAVAEQRTVVPERKIRSRPAT